MRRKKIAVLAARGLGDGLLMQIAAHHLKATLHTDEHQALQQLFPRVAPWPENFTHFDQIIVENDNSARCWDLMRRRDTLAPISFIFPTLNARLKPRSCDYVCDPKLSMAANICKACQAPSVENGIWTPEPARYQMVKQRVVIHPTSKDPKRNWSKRQFADLAQSLAWEGFFPAFITSFEEREQWTWVENHGFALPKLENMKELATFIYEAGYFIGNDSGLGHLASNLKIPTLTLSGNAKRARLWRPGFYHNQLIAPMFPLPNFKGIGLRLRENFWQPFVSMPRVLKNFRKMACAHS